MQRSNQREYERTLLGLQSRLRDAVVKTQHFDAEWNRINDRVKEKIAREQERRAETGRYPKTDLMIAQEKADSLSLKEAFAAGQWWREKAVYLATLIQTEIMLNQELRRIRS